MSEKKILGAKWWTPRVFSLLPIASDTNPCIGMVAFESYAPEGLWKVYMGYGRGEEAQDGEKRDCISILNLGTPLGDKDIACAAFPHLDPEKFVY